MWAMPKAGRNALLLSPRISVSEELWQDSDPLWPQQGVLQCPELWSWPSTYLPFQTRGRHIWIDEVRSAIHFFWEMNSTLRQDPGHDSWDSCLLGAWEDCFFFFPPIQVLPARERTVSGRLGHIVFNLLHGHTLQLHLHQLSANEQGRDYCMEVVQSRATKKFVQEGQTTRSDFPLLTKEDPGRNRIPVSFT